MRHLPAVKSSASAVSRVRGRVILRPDLRVRRVRTDVPLIVRSPQPGPCGSGTETHSGRQGILRLFYSAGSAKRRCVVKAALWGRAVPDSEGYLLRRVRL